MPGTSTTSWRERPGDKPFCFWLGGQEPHRPYEVGAGVRAGKRLEDVVVPKYFPDNRAVRSDMLDYAQEVEWFDTHLVRALDLLEKKGELENTLIAVTSDHGMPFPRVKGQIYDAGFRIPLAVRWGKNIQGGRVVDDFINTRDFAPTWLEAAGVEQAGTMTGSSFLKVLTSGGAARWMRRATRCWWRRSGTTWGGRTTRGIRCGRSARRSICT